MKWKTADDIGDSLFRAAEEGRLFDGQLVQVEGCRPAARSKANMLWRLSSCVPDATFELFRRTRDAGVITSDVLGLCEARAYWVLAYQSRRVQHRFVLPLAGTEVAEMCRALSGGVLGLEMTTLDGKASFLASVPASPQVQTALTQRCATGFVVDAVLQEMLLVSADLLRPGSLRPPPGTRAPTSVSVTGVLPASLQALSRVGPMP